MPLQKSHSAANTAVGIARSNIVAQLSPGCMYCVASMVPGQRGTRLAPLIIERQLVFDLLVGPSRIFVETFVTSTIGCRVILVRAPLFRIRLVCVVFTPIVFFFSCWIHSICPPPYTGFADRRSSGREETNSKSFRGLTPKPFVG